MKTNNFSLVFCGEAGSGVMSAGSAFAELCVRSGLSIFCGKEYPSLIRGGVNQFFVRVSEKEVNGLNSTVDFSVDLSKHKIVVGKDVFVLPEGNVEVLGAVCAYLGVEFKLVEQVIREWVKDSVVIARNGYDSVMKGEFPFCIVPVRGSKKFLLSGNGAVVKGSVEAKCGFLAQYPMTPATEILHDMVKQEGVIVVQPEDEICAVNMALGASFAGKRAMTATSSGGFALMSEAIGLAGMAEVPIVVNLAMRPGPATGLPTRTEQSDLLFAVYSSPDEFAKIVLAPGSVEECYSLTVEAFNLADKFRVPVILLTDKFLATSKKAVVGLKYDGEEFCHEALDFAVGDEHDEQGLINESKENRAVMKAKRLSKMDKIKAFLPGPSVYGNGANVVVCWGSTLGVVLDAVEGLNDVRVVHFSHVWPLSTKKVADSLRGVRKIILVENNALGQLGLLLRQCCGIMIDDNKVLKFDGEQFFVDELKAKLKEVGL